ncbi:hypothetical protein Tco_1489939, partial [Tanacetum coccineum]
MALPPRGQRHQYLRFEVLGYTDANIKDFKERLSKIYGREIHRGQSVFTSQAWRRLFEIRGPLVHELILEFFWILSMRDFLGTTLSYTLIRDSMLSLCHRLIAYNIAVRSQAPEKVAAAGAPEVTKGAPNVDEGDQVVSAPIQASQPPPAAGPARTMTQRINRLEEDVHVMRGALGKQREVFDSMACDFSRFTTWTVTGLSRM